MNRSTFARAVCREEGRLRGEIFALHTPHHSQSPPKTVLQPQLPLALSRDLSKIFVICRLPAFTKITRHVACSPATMSRSIKPSTRAHITQVPWRLTVEGLCRQSSRYGLA